MHVRLNKSMCKSPLLLPRINRCFSDQMSKQMDSLGKHHLDGNVPMSQQTEMHQWWIRPASEQRHQDSCLWNSTPVNMKMDLNAN